MVMGTETKIDISKKDAAQTKTTRSENSNNIHKVNPNSSVIATLVCTCGQEHTCLK